MITEGCIRKLRILDAAVAKKGKRLFGTICSGVFLPSSPLIDIQTVGSPEISVEIKKFSIEQREALEKEGYLIYELTGISIKNLRSSGRKFWSTWHNSLQNFEALASMRSEVAINAKNPFLQKSNNKTLAQQKEMISIFSEELKNRIPDVQAIIGNASDYAELTFKHLDASKNNLFRKKPSYYNTRTKTTTNDSYVANVSCFPTAINPLSLFGLGQVGFSIGEWHATSGLDDIYIIPLIIPTDRKTDEARANQNHMG